MWLASQLNKQTSAGTQFDATGVHEAIHSPWATVVRLRLIRTAGTQPRRQYMTVDLHNNTYTDNTQLLVCVKILQM